MSCGIGRVDTMEPHKAEAAPTCIRTRIQVDV